MPKSIFDGYLTKACHMCPYWMDGSNPDFGVGCGTPFPIDHCPFFHAMSLKEEGKKLEYEKGGEWNK